MIVIFLFAIFTIWRIFIKNKINFSIKSFLVFYLFISLILLFLNHKEVKKNYNELGLVGSDESGYFIIAQDLEMGNINLLELININPSYIYSYLIYLIDITSPFGNPVFFSKGMNVLFNLNFLFCFFLIFLNDQKVNKKKKIIGLFLLSFSGILIILQNLLFKGVLVNYLIFEYYYFLYRNSRRSSNYIKNYKLIVVTSIYIVILSLLRTFSIMFIFSGLVFIYAKRTILNLRNIFIAIIFICILFMLYDYFHIHSKIEIFHEYSTLRREKELYKYNFFTRNILSISFFTFLPIPSKLLFSDFNDVFYVTNIEKLFRIVQAFLWWFQIPLIFISIKTLLKEKFNNGILLLANSIIYALVYSYLYFGYATFRHRIGLYLFGSFMTYYFLTNKDLKRKKIFLIFSLILSIFANLIFFKLFGR